MQPLKITNCTISTALGLGNDKNWQGLLNSQSGLKPCKFPGAETLSTWIGEVPGVDDCQLPPELAEYDCRNNRLAYLALAEDGFRESVAQAVEQYGASRVAVFVGTSTSGILQTELAYQQIDPATDGMPDWYHYATTHNTSSIAEFVRVSLGLAGLCFAVSTACSSSAKVFASAYRAIQSGLCDAAVVGGVDSLCLTTLYGFNSLQLVSADRCRPSSIGRDGLSIGEAGGFALVERNPAKGDMALLGYGESSDAHHMSAPHPEGQGAFMAMQGALGRAGLQADQLDYLNLHGTATPANDLAESKAVLALFGNATPCSSTKGWTGHTLGAAGIVESAFTMASLRHDYLPETMNTSELDPEIKTRVLLEPLQTPARYALTNSFGFGGSNCSLVFGVVS